MRSYASAAIKPLVPVLLACCCAFNAQAQAPGQVSCTDKPECWPDGSAMRSGLLLNDKLVKLDKLLAARHEALVRLVAGAAWPDGGVRLDERLVAALKAQQSAWLKYRSEECELIGSLTGAGGTWPSTYANQCEVNHTELRLRRVDSASRCIQRIAADKRFLEQNECLQQLAPLTNKL